MPVLKHVDVPPLASANAGKHWALLARQVSTSGGSIDTEQNELAVKPHQRPSESLVVTIVAPLGNDDMASRKALEEASTGVPPLEALLGPVQPRSGSNSTPPGERT